jgi:hypothetical protein
MKSRLIYITVVALAISLGVALRWPAMYAGLYTDDYAHHIMLEGSGPGTRAPWNLYTLLSGDKTEIQALKDFGTLGWWCHPEARLAMFRPLSSLSIAFDHYILGYNTYSYHIHSIIWWVVMVLCLAVFLRSLLPMTIAAIAVLLFALEEGNGMLFLWTANRCALMSMAAALLCIWLYIKWRNPQTGTVRGADQPTAPSPNHFRYLISSLVCLFIALLAGEWTYPLFGYLIAFELFRTEEPLKRRMRALLPVLALGVVFAISTRLFGFGSQYSGIYISPIDDFSKFLYQGCLRLFVLIAELILGIPADWWHLGSPWRGFFLSLAIFSPPVWRMLPSWEFWHVTFGMIAAGIAAFLFIWTLKRADSPNKALIKWLTTGSLLALLPMVAPFIASRSVLPAYIGVSAVMSVMFGQSIKTLVRAIREKSPSATAVPGAIIIYILVCQIWLPASRTHREVFASAVTNTTVTRWVLEAEVDDKTIAGKDVIVIAGVEGASTMFAPFVRSFYGRPMPRSWRVLSGAPHAHDLTRIADNVLELQVLGGSMMDSDYERTCRADSAKFSVNETTRIKGLTVVVKAVREGKPIRVQYTFPKSVDDPSYVFLESKAKSLNRIKLPQIGERVRIRKAQMATNFSPRSHHAKRTIKSKDQ